MKERQRSRAGRKDGLKIAIALIASLMPSGGGCVNKADGGT